MSPFLNISIGLVMICNAVLSIAGAFEQSELICGISLGIALMGILVCIIDYIEGKLNDTKKITNKEVGQCWITNDNKKIYILAIYKNKIMGVDITDQTILRDISSLKCLEGKSND
jgi:hypothetical protein